MPVFLGENMLIGLLGCHNTAKHGNKLIRTLTYLHQLLASAYTEYL